MPKMKTKSAAKKRFKKIGGKNVQIKRSKAYRRHLLTKKGPKRRRQLRKGVCISDADRRSILRLLPY